MSNYHRYYHQPALVSLHYITVSKRLFPKQAYCGAELAELVAHVADPFPLSLYLSILYNVYIYIQYHAIFMYTYTHALVAVYIYIL